jgi:serine/threonine protein kinase
MEKMIKKKKFVFPDQKLLERDKGIFVSDNARDLIEKLLIKEPENRLGSKNGVEEILAHPWFSDIDRILMMNKKIKPEFIPKVKPDKEILKES